MTEHPDTFTPLDVAVELVATKLAFVNVVGTLVGTSPALPEAAHDWAYRSPVDLPRDSAGFLDDGLAELVYARSEQIERDLLAAAGQFLVECAERLQVGGRDG